jgi:hypothetical protein
MHFSHKCWGIKMGPAGIKSVSTKNLDDGNVFLLHFVDYSTCLQKHCIWRKCGDSAVL